MYPCVAVPYAVTALYVFAVINLTALLNISLVEASVHVLDDRNKTLVRVQDVEADFSPGLPDDGFQGYLEYTDPPNACSEVKRVFPTVLPVIALIKRNECSFYDKVFNAQQAGYLAAIVHNVNDDDLSSMPGEGVGVNIPSVLITLRSAHRILSVLNISSNYSVIIYPDYNNDILIYLIPFTLVVVLCFVTMIVVLIVKWFRDWRVQRRNRLSKSNLKKLPVKKFKKGDPFDVCAICLDDYEEGDKLRILPCQHGYHQKCIDPWLTENRKLCPICKRKVAKGEDSDSSSDEGGSQPHPPPNSNENTPLVHASIQTSANSGSNQRTLLSVAQELNRGILACPDSSAALRSEANRRSSSAPQHSSRYESNVEVYEDRQSSSNRRAMIGDDSERDAAEAGDAGACASASLPAATLRQSTVLDVDSDDSDNELVGAARRPHRKSPVTDDAKRLLRDEDDEDGATTVLGQRSKDKKKKRKKKRRDATPELV